jgi:FkbM family methyltransferase
MIAIQIGTNRAGDHFEELVKKYKPEDIQVFLVEADSIHNPYILEAYKDYSYTLFNVAITNDASINEVSFYRATVNSGLSSLLKQHIEKHQTGEATLEFKVEALTPDVLFERCGISEQIDLLYIDAEGMDEDILRAINYSIFAPKEIYFENVHLFNKDSLYAFLKDKGYVLEEGEGDGLTTKAALCKR